MHDILGDRGTQTGAAQAEVAGKSVCKLRISGMQPLGAVNKSAAVIRVS
jgi:hypothetical protein